MLGCSILVRIIGLVYKRNCLNFVVFYLLIFFSDFGFLVNLFGMWFFKLSKCWEMLLIICELSLYWRGFLIYNRRKCFMIFK